MTSDNPMDAERIIAAFGGIRPMAKKIGVAVTTVQGWKERGNIPMAHLPKIREVAEREGIDLSDLPQAPEEAAVEETAAQAARTEAPKAPSGGAAGRAERVRAERLGKDEREAASEGGGVRDAGAAAGVVEGKARRARAGAGESAETKRSLRQPAILAGAFGLTLAAGLLIGWQLGLMEAPAGPSDEFATIEQRLDEAESTVGRNAARIADLQRELAGARDAAQAAQDRAEGLEARLEELSAQIGNFDGVSGRIESLSGAVASLQEQVRALAAQSGDPEAARAALSGLTERLDGLEERLGAIDDRLAAVAERVEATGDGVDRAAVDEAVGRAVAEARQALESENAALRERVDALNERIVSLQAAQDRLSEGAGGEAALILALGQLRAAVDEGRPYGELLEHFARLSEGNPDYGEPLAALREHESGVATLAALRTRFEPLSVRIMRAATRTEGENWSERTWGRIKALVTIRRTGADAQGDSVGAVVSRAEAALQAGDLNAAVEELSALSGAPAEEARGWLADARARLAADAALDRLDALAMGAGAAPEDDAAAPDNGE